MRESGGWRRVRIRTFLIAFKHLLPTVSFPGAAGETFTCRERKKRGIKHRQSKSPQKSNAVSLRHLTWQRMNLVMAGHSLWLLAITQHSVSMACLLSLFARIQLFICHAAGYILSQIAMMYPHRALAFLISLYQTFPGRNKPFESSQAKLKIWYPFPNLVLIIIRWSVWIGTAI